MSVTAKVRALRWIEFEQIGGPVALRAKPIRVPVIE